MDVPQRPAGRRSKLALASALAALAAGCSQERASEPLSAVLVTLDTTRADALGAYGRVPAVTPELDRLAREGTLFERAHTVAPITLPAHASMLTGLYPPRHTVRHNGLRPLPQSARTLAEVASEEGHQTAAFVAAAVLSRAFGLDQGFDVYEEPERTERGVSTHFDDQPAGEVVDAALAWLERRDRSRPFLLWVHLFDPHAPYEPPPEFRTGALQSDPYLGEVAYADRELGRLFDALRREGLLERSVVLVVADHGEAFGEHGELSHGAYCYQSTLRVPLILRLPKGEGAGRRSDALVSVVDVYPTLAGAMGLAGAAAEDEIDGRSLLEGGPSPGRGIYFESYFAYYAYGWSPIAGWMDERGKYLHSSTPQLFDLRADPLESRDLASKRDAGPFRDAIAAVAAQPALAAGDPSDIDGDLLDAIRGLGYAGVHELEEPDPHPLAHTGLASPARMVVQHRLLMEATLFTNQGRYGDARRRLEQVLAVDPENPEALELASTCMIQEKRPAEAIPLLRRMVAIGRARATTHFNLAVALWQEGHLDEAHGSLLRALELAPEEPRVLQALAQLLRQDGRQDEAEVYERRLRRLGGS